LAGAIALQQQQDSKAREFFDSALKINKNFAPALVNRAILSFRDLEYSAAEEDLIVAMKVDPINPDTLATYGILQMRLGNFDVAKNALTQALDIKPNHAISRFNLAVLYFDHLKKSDEARRLLTEVLNIKSASKRLKTQSEQYLSRLKTLQSAY
jgi:tetratricopeptide (TPR) repeat protein